MSTTQVSTFSALNALIDPHLSIEWGDEWADEPTLLQAITNQGRFPSLVSLTIPVGSKTLQEFFIHLSLCPDLRELNVKPCEYDEIYECTLSSTDGWAWSALVPNLTSVTAPALLIGRLVPGRAVHTVGIIQEEREDSDAMLRHNLDALQDATLSTTSVENLVLEGIPVPFMRPLLMKIVETFPVLKTLRVATDAMDDINDPDEKYQYGMIPDEIYENVLADVVRGIIRLPATLTILEMVHHSAFMLDYDPIADHGINQNAVPMLREITVGIDSQKRRLQWSDELVAWV